MFRVFAYCALTALIVCAAVLPEQARAELRTLRGAGSSYTANPSKSQTQASKMRHRQVSPEDLESEGDETSSAAKSEAPSENLTEKEIDRIWAKYRALAAGNYREETLPPKMVAAQPQQTQNAAPANDNALAGILQEYRRNKETRRQLRTLTVTPETPASPKKPVPPSAEAP